MLGRIRRWLGGGDAGQAAQTGRWVAIDLETSGLDAGSDRMVSIGAVAVVGARLRPEDSFELIVRQDMPTEHENILIHQIGVQRQLEGVRADEALTALKAFLAGSPLVGFHLAFDKQVLVRAFREHLDSRFESHCLDLAALAPILYPAEAKRRTSLDDWLAFFGIAVAERHSAAGDAAATAELLLRLLPDARAQKLETFKDLLRATRGGRWLVS
jgi:DNA polymerase III subunit epsilon